MTKDEALKLALRAMEYAGPSWIDARQPAITAIKEALAQPEQEPVAWMCADESLINKGYARFSHVCMGDWKIPVYTTPPQRTWVGLTDEEIDDLSRTTVKGNKSVNWLCQAIEAKLKAKNT